MMRVHDAHATRAFTLINNILYSRESKIGGVGERKRGMGKRNGERGFACRFGHDSGSHGYLYNIYSAC